MTDKAKRQKRFQQKNRHIERQFDLFALMIVFVMLAPVIVQFIQSYTREDDEDSSVDK